ncbi:MAG: hypothetical protein Q7R92_03500 [bacterium]|nr:hypothetical protein [bacterium]
MKRFHYAIIIAAAAVILGILLTVWRPEMTTGTPPPKLLVYATIAALALMLIFISINIIIMRRRAMRKIITDPIKDCERIIAKLQADNTKVQTSLNFIKQHYSSSAWKRVEDRLNFFEHEMKGSQKVFNNLSQTHNKPYLTASHLKDLSNSLNNFHGLLNLLMVPMLTNIAETLESIPREADQTREQSITLLKKLPTMIKSARATYQELPDQRLIAIVKGNFEDAVIASASKSSETDWLKIHKILCAVKQALEDIRTAAEERKQAIEQEEQAKQTAPKLLETLLLAVEGAENKNDSEEVKSLLADAGRVLSAAQILASLEPCSWSKVSQLLNAAEKLYCQSIDSRAIDEAHASLRSNLIISQDQK